MDKAEIDVIGVSTRCLKKWEQRVDLRVFHAGERSRDLCPNFNLPSNRALPIGSGNSMKIEFREINRGNLRECIKLELDAEQAQRITSNAVSLAESKYKPGYRDCAYIDVGAVVGYEASLQLYQNCGFVKTGETIGREIQLRIGTAKV